MTGQNILRVTRAAIPFFLLLVALLVLIGAFPWLVTWLPELMSSR